MDGQRNVEPHGALSFKRVAAPVLRRMRWLLVVALAISAVVGGYSFTRPRQYQASLAFSTVAPGRANGISASLPAALLAATSAGGLQASPALLSRLVRSENVETRVARMKPAGRGDSTVADLLFGRRSSSLSDPQVARKLESVITSQSDRETGLVTVGANHPDSALARYIVEKVVDEVTIAFQNAVKSQVSEVKSSISMRLEAASERLRSAEQRWQEFSSRNRLIEPSSPAAIERDRLSRDLTLAQSLYNQAVLERESAKDRELEPVPTVVIVDPVPQQLTPIPRSTLLKAMIAFALSFLILSALVIFADLLQTGRMTEEQEREYFRNSVLGVPFVKAFIKPPERREFTA